MKLVVVQINPFGQVRQPGIDHSTLMASTAP